MSMRWAESEVCKRTYPSAIRLTASAIQPIQIAGRTDPTLLETADEDRIEMLFAGMRMSAIGTKRTFPAAPIDVRFWG